MGDKTGIEWTDATWNPVLGCEKVSAGCDNCYAIPMSARVGATGNAAYQGLVGYDAAGRRDWSGLVRELPERLDQPIRWTKPRRIFVNSMSDLFHGDVTREFQAQVFAVMAITPRHTYQVLTKRPGVMRSVLSSDQFHRMVEVALTDLRGRHRGEHQTTDAWPLPNVWLGTSVEDQATADLRIPQLLATPAAVRFLSMEPLLGPVSLRHYLDPERECRCMVPPMEGAGVHAANCRCLTQPEVGWVIVGGESGPGARPMDAQWVRDLRDQCTLDRVPFHFKQWGSHREDGTPTSKRRAGRVLDGRTWDEWPRG